MKSGQVAEQVTPNIYLGTDGKYHWYYEYKLMKNPTIFYTTMKVLWFSMFLVYLFVLSLDLFGGSPSWKGVFDITKGFACLMLVMLVVGWLGYALFALIHGWSYCVMFEMDEHGVTHTQMPQQFKKAQALSLVEILAGIATRRPGMVGQGMITASRQGMYSSWSTVKNIEIIRRRNVIKVNEKLFHNQVYAEKEDFEFVENYIKAHVSSKCKIHYW